jgi:hypothetical protein
MLDWMRTETPLWAALRGGVRDDVVDLLLAMPPSERRRMRPAMLAHDRLVTSFPTGHRAPAGEWDGPLRAAHWSASAAAVLGCSTPQQATRYAPLDMPDAVDLPVSLFPQDLQLFADEWFARFLRNPKAWDRIRGLEAVFEWAHRGLLRPPTSAGAVLFLVSSMPGARRGREVLRYLEQRPVLIDTTFAGLFDVVGIKGASPAQRDETTPWPEERLDNHVIPQLIRRGHWTAEFVRDGVRRALARDLPPHQARWFRGLEQHLPAR